MSREPSAPPAPARGSFGRRPLAGLGLALSVVVAVAVRERAVAVARMPARVGGSGHHDHTGGARDAVPAIFADPAGAPYAVFVLLAAVLLVMPLLALVVAAHGALLARTGRSRDGLASAIGFCVAVAAASAGAATVLASSLLSLAIEARQGPADVRAVVVGVLRYSLVVAIGFVLLIGARRGDAGHAGPRRARRGPAVSTLPGPAADPSGPASHPRLATAGTWRLVQPRDDSPGV